MTHFEILVEEPSAEAALQILLPKIIGSASYNLRAFQGKGDLLASLPNLMRGYASYLGNDSVIFVLVDRDDEDCRTLKAQLELIAVQAGLITKSLAGTGQRFQVINRILVEELEAWFLGDADAVHQAFPRVSPGFAGKVAYRDPDGIRGGTWEALLRLLQRSGYYKTGLAKIDAAQRIAAHMNPAQNRSASFDCFRSALIECLETTP